MTGVQTCALPIYSDMVNFLIEAELPFLIVLTKADKLKKSAYEERLAAFRDELPESDQVVVIPFSSETGQGVEELRAVLQDLYEYYSAEGAEDDAF